MEIESKEIKMYELNVRLSLVEIMDMLNVDGLIRLKEQWTVAELFKLHKTHKHKLLSELIDYIIDNKMTSSDDTIIVITNGVL